MKKVVIDMHKHKSKIEYKEKMFKIIIYLVIIIIILSIIYYSFISPRYGIIPKITQHNLTGIDLWRATLLIFGAIILLSKYLYIIAFTKDCFPFCGDDNIITIIWYILLGLAALILVIGVIYIVCLF